MFITLDFQVFLIGSFGNGWNLRVQGREVLGRE